jgi:hypothetical protein
MPRGPITNSWGFLFIKLRNIRHRSEQPEGLIEKRQEALTLIEAAGRLILSIDDNGERRDLTTNRAEQSVGEQEAAVPSPLIVLIDGEPAQKRRRDEWIARQFAGDISRKFGEFHAGRGLGDFLFGPFMISSTAAMRSSSIFLRIS